jgi:hypothetical protein
VPHRRFGHLISTGGRPLSASGPRASCLRAGLPCRHRQARRRQAQAGAGKSARGTPRTREADQRLFTAERQKRMVQERTKTQPCTRRTRRREACVPVHGPLHSLLPLSAGMSAHLLRALRGFARPRVPTPPSHAKTRSTRRTPRDGEVTSASFAPFAASREPVSRPPVHAKDTKGLGSDSTIRLHPVRQGRIGGQAVPFARLGGSVGTSKGRCARRRIRDALT